MKLICSIALFSLQPSTENISQIVQDVIDLFIYRYETHKICLTKAFESSEQSFSSPKSRIYHSSMLVTHFVNCKPPCKNTTKHCQTHIWRWFYINLFDKCKLLLFTTTHYLNERVSKMLWAALGLFMNRDISFWETDYVSQKSIQSTFFTYSCSIQPQWPFII